MQGPSGEAERNALEGEAIPVQISAAGIAKWTRIIVLVYVVGFAFALWENDEFRLQFLHLAIKICQLFARTFGYWALSIERSYNEYTESLH